MTRRVRRVRICVQWLVRGVCPQCQGHDPRRVCGTRNAQLPSSAGVLERWVQTSLKVDASGSIPAREAYSDFCRWACAVGIEPCTETRFGRNFSARIINLGGMKVKRRDRAYYHGVMFKMPSVQDIRRGQSCRLSGASTCFGSKGSGVRISPLRPIKSIT